MKTTGVLRRIDDLGRIVIPKEIRKNLKIRDGELLEIFIEGDKIILAKHSIMQSIDDTAKMCVDAVNDILSINMLITDRDKVIAASIPLRKKYLDKDLSVEATALFLKYNSISSSEPKKIKITNEEEENTSYISYPIVLDGDVAGMVLTLGLDNKLSDIEDKITSIIAKFLSRNIV